MVPLQPQPDRPSHGMWKCFLIVILLTSSGCAGQAKEIQVPNPPENHRYLLVERDEVIELQRISVRVSGNPFVPSAELLIENGGDPAADEAETMPRWPAQARVPDQELVRKLVAVATSNTPPWDSYRDWRRLMQAARRINPELVQSSQAWLVGTNPLVLAYRDASPDAALYRRLAKDGTDSTLGTILRFWDTGKTQPSTPHVVPNEREVALLRRFDREPTVNILLMYDRSAHVAAIDATIPLRPLDDTGKTPPGKLLILKELRPLREVMRTLAEGKIEAQAEHVIELPVR